MGHTRVGHTTASLPPLPFESVLIKLDFRDFLGNFHQRALLTELLDQPSKMIQIDVKLYKKYVRLI